MRKCIFRNILIFTAVSSAVTALTLCAVLVFSGGNNLIFKAVLIAACVSAIMAAAARNAAKKAAESIAGPINAVDLAHAANREVCEEIQPFLERIDAENLGKAQTEQMRREFSANVSHELKTPLTSILGYAEMINNGMAKSEDIPMFAERIEKEASRLILLIDDIIKLSHLDEQEDTIEAEPLDLAIAAQETIASLEKAAKDKGVGLFYSGEKTVINGSRTLIGELMYNLIDNAVKYNRKDGHVIVFVGTGADGKVFAVKDTGLGIPEADIERIFERFYRVDKSHSKTVGGTGLGLSIVKHIAMCHNARIDVKSKMGEGTTISVVFEQQ